MLEPAVQFEHAGLTVQIVPDDDWDCTNPLVNQDNAGTIYSWTRDFDGDERISEPDLEIDVAEGEYDDPDWQMVDLPTYMRHEHDAVLTIGLRFADYGSSGARLYVDNDDPNCCICFTQKEIDEEWNGSVDDATKYATARLDEIDLWLQGNIYGFVIRDGDEVLESVWGFIDGEVWTEDPEKSHTIQEAMWAAEHCRESLDREAAEAFRWACADVVTV